MMLKLCAVMVLHELSTDSVILTERTAFLNSHPGEICFPGGMYDAGDMDLRMTALRELEEELGITPSRVTILHALEKEITLLGRVINPWFGTIETIDPFTPNINEVAAVHSVPFSLACRKENYQEKVITRQGKQFTTCQFSYHNHLIWGATARIMKQLAGSS